MMLLFVLIHIQQLLTDPRQKAEPETEINKQPKNLTVAIIAHQQVTGNTGNKFIPKISPFSETHLVVYGMM